MNTTFPTCWTLFTSFWLTIQLTMRLAVPKMRPSKQVPYALATVITCFVALTACRSDNTSTNSATSSTATKAQQAKNGSLQTADSKNAAAIVNGEVILKSTFEAEVARNMTRYQSQGHQLPANVAVRIKESVLRRMIDDAIIAQQAQKIGADVSDEELLKRFLEHKNRFQTTEAFTAYLERSHNTETSVKADLLRNLLRERVVEKMAGKAAMEEDDIKKYYNENKSRFVAKEQLKASRVLLRLRPNEDPKKKSALKKNANQIRHQLASKGADFSAIARRESNAPEASRGGELGWMAKGRMPPDFEKVAFAMKAGTLSKVIETTLGFEIIKVWERKAERQKKYDEVKDLIKNSLLARLRNDKRRDVLRQIKETAKIEKVIKFAPPPARPREKRPPAPQIPGMVNGKPRLPAGKLPQHVLDAAKKNAAAAKANHPTNHPTNHTHNHAH